ncbi:Cysteinyl-tRNA synthetase [[Mycoplasma] cavipharyngis]|uniref:cysteine--tRNA ligase n=1 Tax=[Mycoplasma] cavipharyngis TaxID=92757 RepID=UPI003704C616
MTTIKIFDSTTNQKKILNDPIISIYACGPTVYNHIHLGNLRTPITFDLFTRFLKLINRPFLYVHNITDVDDKIINQALKEEISETDLVEKYTNAYLAILDQMQIIRPNFLPKVSTNISGIISYIDKIIQKNKAYVVAGDVWFKVSGISQYGELSKQNLDQLINQSRELNNQANKKDAVDFVLWKKTNLGINWNAPWSVGRPGWHTECAFFINHFIGPQATIHGGGLDLKFPHHENENAQNYALYDLAIAKVWMHIGIVTVNNQKMAKSLNNFILVKDILEQYDSNVIRYFFCQTHYQNPLDFNWDKLALIKKMIIKLFHPIHVARTKLVDQTYQTPTITIDQKLVDILSDNFNLANYLTFLEELKNNLNQVLKTNQNDLIALHLAQLVFHLESFGFIIPNLHDQMTIVKIRQWRNFLATKNYQLADQMREQLINLGVW